MAYTPTIGLEVHAELKTETKLFCISKNDPDEKRPNVNICPICMGHPGTLPVLNKKAVRHVLMVGCALDGVLADFTEFDRKNYFYPDIPKGYQISQYQHPLVSGGSLQGVAITRVHLEEDTARSTHESGAYSLIDFNRAGIPLMELVTEPVIRSAKEAVDFARELQLILRYLGASDANMEKGEMRVEANISVSEDDTKGTKVEVKNLNSFRTVERAIAFEIERQTKLLLRGESVVQETRGWDERKQQTYSQRLKEGSKDYRYFPEPDIPKLTISEIQDFKKEVLLDTMPELPAEKRSRYKEMYGLRDEGIEVFVRSAQKDALFCAALLEWNGEKDLAQEIANYITVEIPAIEKKVHENEGGTSFEMERYKPLNLAKLASMKLSLEISSRGVKDILAEMLVSGDSPEIVASRKGLLQKSSEGELDEIVEKIIEEHGFVADEYRNGKDSVLKFLIGQGMKATKGSGNPETLRALFEKKLR